MFAFSNCQEEGAAAIQIIASYPPLPPSVSSVAADAPSIDKLGVCSPIHIVTSALAPSGDRRPSAKAPYPNEILKCPRCESLETKFCYYNNNSLTQPRYFCKECKRYWTAGGALRNVPVGGGIRKNKRTKLLKLAAAAATAAEALNAAGTPDQCRLPAETPSLIKLENRTTVNSGAEADVYSLSHSIAGNSGLNHVITCGSEILEKYSSGNHDQVAESLYSLHEKRGVNFYDEADYARQAVSNYGAMVLPSSAPMSGYVANFSFLFSEGALFDGTAEDGSFFYLPSSASWPDFSDQLYDAAEISL